MWATREGQGGSKGSNVSTPEKAREGPKGVQCVYSRRPGGGQKGPPPTREGPGDWAYGFPAAPCAACGLGNAILAP